MQGSEGGKPLLGVLHEQPGSFGGSYGEFEITSGFCWKIHDNAATTRSQAASAKAANLEHRV